MQQSSLQRRSSYTSAQLLAAPEGLQAEIMCASAIQLIWQAPVTGATGFRIERQQDGGVWFHIGTLSATCPQFESTGLLSGHVYRHRVCIISDEMGDWSVSDALTMPTGYGTHQSSVLVPVTDEHPRSGEGSFVLLKNGQLVYYYATYLHSRVDWAEAYIASITSDDMGASWQAPQLVLAHTRYRYTRISVARMPDGRLLLVYGRQLPADHTPETDENLPAPGDELHVVCRTSDDDGQTWSEETVLSDDRRWRFTHSMWDGIRVLSNGRILVEMQCSQSQEATYGTYIKYSDDNARTWSRTPESGCMIVLDNPYANAECGFWEVGIVEYEAGKLLAHGRTVTGWLYECRSDDYGSTWSAPTRLDIRQSKSPPVLTKIPGTSIIVRIWNPYQDVYQVYWHLGKRIILATQLSDDGGLNWHGYREIENGDGYDWYAYPTVYWIGDQLHLAYFCWQHEGETGEGHGGLEVRYRRVNRDWLLGIG